MRTRSTAAALPAALALSLPALVALAGLPAGAAAQEGAITFDRATRLAVELPDRIQERFGDEIPGESFETLVLLFSPAETVMIPAPDGAPEGEGAGDGGDAPAPGTDAFRARRLQDFLSRVQRMSPERTDQERLLVVHTDLASGAVVENRVFMGRTFLVRGVRPEIRWRITGEQTEFAGHLVMKALATVDDTLVEAWFTPQIPVPAGPGEYGGLPGMILSLSIDGGRIVYSATGIRMAAVDEGAIRPPGQGQEVGREEYEELVAERLEELRVLSEQRGGRRGGG